MSYQYRILADIPRAAYPLNPGEAGSFVDYSGNNVVSTIYGTITEAPPLVVGGGSSRLVSDANGFSFTPNTITDIVNNSFTMEIWFKPVAAGRIQLIGHNHFDDGISWDGESISFRTKHGVEPACIVSYNPPAFNSSFCVQGVHTPTKNQLYVDGNLVGETDLTTAQMAAGVAGTGPLYVGQALTGTPSALIDSVAYYRNAMSPVAAANHYAWGIDVPKMTSVVSYRGGRYWTMNDPTAQVEHREDYFDTYTWSSGITNGLNYSSGTLLPTFDDAGLTIGANWVTGFILDQLATTFDGSKIEWDSDGSAVVESSIDNGQTWTTCVNGQEIPNISEGFVTAGKSITVRVSFPSGEAFTTNTAMRSLSIILYRSRLLAGNSGATTLKIHGSVGMDSEYHEPIEYYDNWGTTFVNGTATITVDPTEPVRTIEMWVKLNSAAAGTIVDARSGSADTTSLNITTATTSNATTYVNGAASALNMAVGRWYHVVAVANAGITNNIILNGNYAASNKPGISIGMVAVYPTALTLSDSTSLYNSYLGIPTGQIVDSSQAIVSEDSPGFKIYGLDWSVSGT